MKGTPVVEAAGVVDVDDVGRRDARRGSGLAKNRSMTIVDAESSAASTLTATFFPSESCSASYTAAMPPRPISRTTRYFPTRTCPTGIFDSLADIYLYASKMVRGFATNEKASALPLARGKRGRSARKRDSSDWRRSARCGRGRTRAQECAPDHLRQRLPREAGSRRERALSREDRAKRADRARDRRRFDGARAREPAHAEPVLLIEVLFVARETVPEGAMYEDRINASESSASARTGPPLAPLQCPLRERDRGRGAGEGHDRDAGAEGRGQDRDRGRGRRSRRAEGDRRDDLRAARHRAARRNRARARARPSRGRGARGSIALVASPAWRNVPRRAPFALECSHEEVGASRVRARSWPAIAIFSARSDVEEIVVAPS